MLLGFISLLITVGTNYIAKICIPYAAGDTMLPCKKGDGKDDYDGSDDRRKLLSYGENVIWRRGLAAAGGDDYCSKNVNEVASCLLSSQENLTINNYLINPSFYH